MDLSEQARELLIAEQYEYAIYIYTSQIEDNVDKKTRATAYLQRATCFIKMHKYQEAIEDIQNAASLHKIDPTSYKKLAKCYLIVGDINGSKQAMINLSNSDTDKEDKEYAIRQKKIYEDIEEREIKAKKAYKDEEYDKVIELMDQCLEISESCVRHKILKAKCLIYLRKFGEASNVVNEILFSNKEDYEAIYVRGLNLIHQGKYRLGLEELKQTIEHSPKGRDLYKKYTEIERWIEEAKIIKHENINKAKEIFTRILKIDKRNLEQIKNMYTALAKISFIERNFDEAMLYSTKALLINEKSIQCLNIRAKTSIALNDYINAIEDYKQILRIRNIKEYSDMLKDTQQKMKRNTDHFRVLGVEKGCNKIDIVKARNRLALIYHPDKLLNKSQAEQIIGKRKFDNISKSYDELMKQYT